MKSLYLEKQLKKYFQTYCYIIKDIFMILFFQDPVNSRLSDWKNLAPKLDAFIQSFFVIIKVKNMLNEDINYF